MPKRLDLKKGRKPAKKANATKMNPASPKPEKVNKPEVLAQQDAPGKGDGGSIRERKVRAPRKRLCAWNDNDWRQVVLGVTHALAAGGIDFPWGIAAHYVSEGQVTGSALQQSILKLRDRQRKDPANRVPSIRMNWGLKHKELVTEYDDEVEDEPTPTEAHNIEENDEPLAELPLIHHPATVGFVETWNPLHHHPFLKSPTDYQPSIDHETDIGAPGPAHNVPKRAIPSQKKIKTGTATSRVPSRCPSRVAYRSTTSSERHHPYMRNHRSVKTETPEPGRIRLPLSDASLGQGNVRPLIASPPDFDPNHDRLANVDRNPMASHGVANANFGRNRFLTQNVVSSHPDEFGMPFLTPTDEAEEGMAQHDVRTVKDASMPSASGRAYVNGFMTQPGRSRFNHLGVDCPRSTQTQGLAEGDHLVNHVTNTVTSNTFYGTGAFVGNTANYSASINTFVNANAFDYVNVLNPLASNGDTMGNSHTMGYGINDPDFGLSGDYIDTNVLPKYEFIDPALITTATHQDLYELPGSDFDAQETQFADALTVEDIINAPFLPDS
ncbi:hypothetical protein B0J11DRAFT_507602 [Dendryphion nanum]|uniref:Uncharacterized protein n=1 Tax=Dendryphion nanum TaxID=256645 RepID=A0A9P9IKK1_9PLEO|nr:hypothetical protein B0J11DRAFT_507602 [Dendryphion nanum]